jgi:hypothetical protein
MRRLMALSVLGLGIAGFAACNDGGKSVGSAGTPAASTGGAASEDSIGVPECDDYLKKMEACLAKMPAEAKVAIEQGFRQSREAWKQAVAAGGKDNLKPGCQAALAALDQNPACK